MINAHARPVGIAADRLPEMAVRPSGRALLARAVAAYGDNPIAAYALDPDKTGLVSGRLGGIAFRHCLGVALAAGDPIAPPERRPALADHFIHYCRAHGWIPAFYQVLHHQIDAYRRLGLSALKIGEEALIDLPSFSLEGGRIANVRHCVTHAKREGLRAEVYPDGVEDVRTLRELGDVSRAWLSEGGRGEMGFSMGRWSEEAARSACVALARDGHGRVRAFVTFRRVPAARGVVLDLLRRDAGAPSGSIDFLLARTLERCRDAGLAIASLSLAPLANADEDGRHPLVERLLTLLYERGAGIYHYRSLYRFKRKFGPRWEPRYLLYPDGPLNLARVAAATALVHRPHGLLGQSILPWSG